MEDQEETRDTAAVVWRPRDYYDPPPGLPYAIILLNQGLRRASLGSVRQWWCSEHGTFMRSRDESASHSSPHTCPAAHLRLCVDGATNAFHHLLQQRQEKAAATAADASSAARCSCPLPDLISGDFDSVRPDVLKEYAAQGVRIVATPDQDETDFTKALRLLADLLKEQQVSVSHILVVAGSDNSRFDHVMAIIATLYKAPAITSTPVVVVSGGSLFWVLRAGRHSITVPGELCRCPSASWCGLVPVGHPATATTTGLKWNIDNQTLAFGHLVSTSNTYHLPASGGEVTVTTSSPLLWTMDWRAEPDHFPAELTDLQNGSLDHT